MTGCVGCGECCTLVNARHDELKRIRHYMRDNGVRWQPPEVRPSGRTDGVNPYCGFLRAQDDGTWACGIYPVRPWVCRAFGVFAEMVCSYSPEEARFELSADEVRGRRLGSGFDKTLGEVFEPGYRERLAPYFEAVAAMRKLKGLLA
jgi:Fe-S-cluster containining protein